MVALGAKLYCAECSCQLDWALEPAKARQNPRRLFCPQPSCKNYGAVFLAPVLILREE